MLDALAAGLRESSGKPFVGPKLPNLNAFFDRCARASGAACAPLCMWVVQAHRRTGCTHDYTCTK